MPVTFYPSVIILQDRGEVGIEIDYLSGSSSSGDTLFRDTGPAQRPSTLHFTYPDRQTTNNK